MRANRSIEELAVRKGRLGLGVVLLGVSIVLACGAILLGRQSLERQSATLAGHISKAETEQRLTAAAVRIDESGQLSEVALVQLNRQVGMINRDWGRLLSTLVPETDEVRLLSIDVEPVTGVIRVSGASDSAERANAYSALLEARAVVGDVRLLSLERNGTRVVFEVTARWAK